MIPPLDLSQLLKRELDYKTTSPIVEFPAFTREVYLFGEYNLQETGAKIDFNVMNERCVQAIGRLGFNLAKIPIREGSDEEMGDAKGKYLQSNEILLARRYYRPGSGLEENAEPHDTEFFLDHCGQGYPELWRTDHLARLSHMAEDIVVHEYGHKVYRENFQEEIVKRTLETVLVDKRPDLWRSLALVYSSDLEEGFARWLNYAVVGHEHPANIEALVLLSSEELRAMGKKSYNDRKAVADFYKLLKRTSDEHSVEHITQNLPAIAVDFIRAKHERVEKERAEQIAQFRPYIFTIGNEEITP